MQAIKRRGFLAGIVAAIGSLFVRSPAAGDRLTFTAAGGPLPTGISPGMVYVDLPTKPGADLFYDGRRIGKVRDFIIERTMFFSPERKSILSRVTMTAVLTEDIGLTPLAQPADNPGSGSQGQT